MTTPTSRLRVSRHWTQPVLTQGHFCPSRPSCQEGHHKSNAGCPHYELCNRRCESIGIVSTLAQVVLVTPESAYSMQDKQGSGSAECQQQGLCLLDSKSRADHGGQRQQNPPKINCTWWDTEAAHLHENGNRNLSSGQDQQEVRGPRHEDTSDSNHWKSRTAGDVWLQ